MSGYAPGVTNGGVLLNGPSADGSANQYLKTDGAGNLSFGTVDLSGYQPLDADLTALAALGYTSGSFLIKKTAANTYSLIALTAAGEALLDDADAAAQRTTMGALGGSLGSADNRLLRSDGTGGATAQASGINCDDSVNVSGINNLTASGNAQANRVISSNDVEGNSIVVKNGGSVARLFWNSTTLTLDDNAGGSRDLAITGNLTASGTGTFGDNVTITKSAGAFIGATVVNANTGSMAAAGFIAQNNAGTQGGVTVCGTAFGNATLNGQTQLGSNTGIVLMTDNAGASGGPNTIKLVAGGWAESPQVTVARTVVTVGVNLVTSHIKVLNNAGNTYDIGENTYRFRDGYFAGTLYSGPVSCSNLTASGSLTAVFVTATSGVTVGSSGPVVWSGRSQLLSPSNGTIAAKNSDGTTDSAFTCGNLTASGTGAFAGSQVLISTVSTLPAIWLGTAAVASPGTSNYALLRSPGQSTVLNAGSGEELHFRIANSNMGVISATGASFGGNVSATNNIQAEGMLISGLGTYGSLTPGFVATASSTMTLRTVSGTAANLVVGGSGEFSGCNIYSGTGYGIFDSGAPNANGLILRINGNTNVLSTQPVVSSGTIYVNNLTASGTISSSGLTIGDAGGYPYLSAASTGITFGKSGTAFNLFIAATTSGRVGLGNNSQLGWSSSSDPSGTQDVYFQRTAAGTCGLTGNLSASGTVTVGASTFAALPSASANTGAILRITDRGQKLAQSDGTDWRFVHDNTIAS